ncbi:MAG: thiolase domain-containing protein [Propionibacteriaceae bacterium]|nr:thiolase domain-containing protein [Propionibacteriaceae bacterium]
MTGVAIVGAFEHPTRKATGISLGQLHAESVAGALADAGLGIDDIDGFCCATNDTPGGLLNLADYLGLRSLTWVDGTDTGGSSYLVHVGHAVEAIRSGRCTIVLITMAGRPKAAAAEQGAVASGLAPRATHPEQPDAAFEGLYGATTVTAYAMCAMRHRHDFGTTAEQLAWVKVAASEHAQWNEHAVLRTPVTVEDVVSSPMIADPLHRLDCCLVTDGGGALIVAREDIARRLARPLVRVRGHGAAASVQGGGSAIELTSTAAVRSGRMAFEAAGVGPGDIRYASIYDSFTITVVMQLEDLGFCAKGEGGRFVADGNLISGVGALPWNTDGGGLCNNHPGNRGGMTKLLEAVRQTRGEAHPKVQVGDPRLTLAHGTGMMLGVRHMAATVVLERG